MAQLHGRKRRLRSNRHWPVSKQIKIVTLFFYIKRRPSGHARANFVRTGRMQSPAWRPALSRTLKLEGIAAAERSLPGWQRTPTRCFLGKPSLYRHYAPKWRLHKLIMLFVLLHHHMRLDATITRADPPARAFSTDSDRRT